MTINKNTKYTFGKSCNSGTSIICNVNFENYTFPFTIRLTEKNIFQIWYDGEKRKSFVINKENLELTDDNIKNIFKYCIKSLSNDDLENIFKIKD